MSTTFTVLTALLAQLEAPTTRFMGSGVPKGAVIIVTSIMMYVLPTLLAFKRDRHKKWRIAAINLLLGWTLIGWIVAMLMTYAYEPPRDGEPPDTVRVPGTPRF